MVYNATRGCLSVRKLFTIKIYRTKYFGHEIFAIYGMQLHCNVINYSDYSL